MAKKSAEADYSKPASERVLTNLKDLGFVRLSSDEIGVKVRKCMPTGVPCIDIMSARDVNGVWGLPFGRQIEIYGGPDSCKTSLAIQIAASAQQQGYMTAWVEMEHSLNRDRAITIGANIDDLYISTPDYLEQSLIQLKNLVLQMPPHDSQYYKEDECLVVLYDSLGSAMPKAEYEGEEDEEAKVGLWQKRMTRFFRRMRKEVSIRNVILVYTNQVYARIGAFGFGKKTQAFGGNSPKYFCGLRFETTYTGKLKDSAGNVVGITFNIENVKNKCLAPFKKFQGIEFKFDRGFNREQALLMALEDMKLAKKTGSNYTVGDEQYKAADFVKKCMSEEGFYERHRDAIDNRERE